MAPGAAVMAAVAPAVARAEHRLGKDPGFFTKPQSGEEGSEPGADAATSGAAGHGTKPSSAAGLAQREAELSSVTWSGFELKETKPSQQNYSSKPFLSSN